MEGFSNETSYYGVSGMPEETQEQLLAETKAKFTAVSEKSEKKFTF